MEKTIYESPIRALSMKASEHKLFLGMGSAGRFKHLGDYPEKKLARSS